MMLSEIEFLLHALRVGPYDSEACLISSSFLNLVRLVQVVVKDTGLE